MAIHYSDHFLLPEEEFLPRMTFNIPEKSDDTSISPLIQDKFTKLQQDIASSNPDVTNPKRIISSLVDYIANDFNSSDDCWSCDDSTVSSSGGPLTPEMDAHGRKTASDSRPFTRPSIKRRTSYFDGWDGTVIEEEEENVNDIRGTLDNVNYHSEPFFIQLPGDNSEGALIQGDDYLDAAEPPECQSQQGGFFLNFFGVGRTKRTRNESEPTPQEKYKLSMKKHYEHALKLARKRAVSATFRSQVYRIPNQA